MDRLSQERDRDGLSAVREPEPPAPVEAGSLAWASAIGNQAVQRLARQAAPEETETAELEAEEEPPQEVAAMEAAGIGPSEAAGLEALDDLAEDELPE